MTTTEPTKDKCLIMPVPDERDIIIQPQTHRFIAAHVAAAGGRLRLSTGIIALGEPLALALLMEQFGRRALRWQSLPMLLLRLRTGGYTVNQTETTVKQSNIIRQVLTMQIAFNQMQFILRQAQSRTMPATAPIKEGTGGGHHRDIAQPMNDTRRLIEHYRQPPDSQQAAIEMLASIRHRGEQMRDMDLQRPPMQQRSNRMDNQQRILRRDASRVEVDDISAPARVLRRSTAPAEQSASAAAHRPAATQAGRPPPLQPSLPDIDRITEQVIQQIDRRIIARRERLGK